jgi:hypothetical protein
MTTQEKLIALRDECRRLSATTDNLIDPMYLGELIDNILLDEPSNQFVDLLAIIGTNHHAGTIEALEQDKERLEDRISDLEAELE